MSFLRYYPFKKMYTLYICTCVLSYAHLFCPTSILACHMTDLIAEHMSFMALFIINIYLSYPWPTFWVQDGNMLFSISSRRLPLSDIGEKENKDGRAICI